MKKIVKRILITSLVVVVISSIYYYTAINSIMQKNDVVLSELKLFETNLNKVQNKDKRIVFIKKLGNIGDNSKQIDYDPENTNVIKFILYAPQCKSKMDNLIIELKELNNEVTQDA